MDRLLSIVRTAELAVILGSAIAMTVSWGLHLRRVQEARRNVRTLMLLGHFNWTADHGDECPPDAAAIARHMGCGRTVDPWGTPYQLECREHEQRESWPHFVVFSAGPDRIAGTRDDIHIR